MSAKHWHPMPRNDNQAVMLDVRFGAPFGPKSDIAGSQFGANFGSHAVALSDDCGGLPVCWPFVSLVWVNVISRLASIRRERVRRRVSKSTIVTCEQLA
jgi:hypothetical protein